MLNHLQLLVNKSSEFLDIRHWHLLIQNCRLGYDKDECLNIWMLMVLNMVLMLVLMLALVVRRAKAQKVAESLDLFRVLPHSPAKKVHQHILHIVTYGNQNLICLQVTSLQMRTAQLQ